MRAVNFGHSLNLCSAYTGTHPWLPPSLPPSSPGNGVKIKAYYRNAEGASEDKELVYLGRYLVRLATCGPAAAGAAAAVVGVGDGGGEGGAAGGENGGKDHRNWRDEAKRREDGGEGGGGSGGGGGGASSGGSA
eukprot:evm.model.NODE_55205_length_7744_cov_49.628098.1